MYIPKLILFQYKLSLIIEQIIGSKLFEKKLKSWRNFLEKKIEVALTHSNRDTTPTNVDRLSDLSQSDFVKSYLNKHVPVIFSGQAKEWLCCQKWSLDYFVNLAGSDEVLIVGAPGITQPVNHKDVDVEILKLKELIKNIEAGGEKYLRFSPLVEKNKKLAADLNLTWLSHMQGKNTFAQTFYLFLGGKGRKTFLHSDQPGNIYVQVTGHKRWVLYDIKETPFLYPALTNTAYVNSSVSLSEFDPKQFPLFKFAKPMIVDLYAGDILYVPPYMWHQVENMTESIAVGYRFTALRLAITGSFTFLLLRLLATKPPVWKTGKLGKIDTNLIWAYSAGKLNEALGNKKIR